MENRQIKAPKPIPKLTAEEQENAKDFFTFVVKNDHEIITEMLEAWPNLVHARDENGNTPLNFAIRSKSGAADLETVKILMAHGSDAYAPNKNNMTPIHAIRHLDDQSFARAFAIALDSSLEADFAELDASLRAKAAASAAASKGALAKADAYMNSKEYEESEATLNKLGAGGKKTDGKCTIMACHEITYDNQLINDLFNRPLNMDEVKSLNLDIAMLDLQLPSSQDYVFHQQEISEINFIPENVMDQVTSVARIVGQIGVIIAIGGLFIESV